MGVWILLLFVAAPYRKLRYSLFITFLPLDAIGLLMLIISRGPPGIAPYPLIFLRELGLAAISCRVSSRELPSILLFIALF